MRIKAHDHRNTYKYPTHACDKFSKNWLGYHGARLCHTAELLSVIFQMTSVRQYKLTLHNCTRVFCWMLRTDVLVFPIAFMTSFLSSIERAHGNFYSSITTSPCVLPHYNSLLSAAAIRSYASASLTAAANRFAALFHWSHSPWNRTPFLGRPTAPEHDSRNGQFHWVVDRRHRISDLVSYDCVSCIFEIQNSRHQTGTYR